MFLGTNCDKMAVFFYFCRQILNQKTMQQSANFLGNIPTVTKNLIIINLLLWIASVAMTRLDMVGMFGLYYPAAKNFRLYQLITYMFMHGSFAHIFFNMFAVYMFGRVLESSVWGPKRFLLYYMITGIGAGLIQILVAYIRIKSVESGLGAEAIAMVYREGADIMKQNLQYTHSMYRQLNLLINTPTVGASGAVFGILLAFGMFFPNIPLYIIPFPFPIKAKYMVIGYGAIELFAGFANFSFDNIAHFAHLGGMLFGIILILFWRKKDKNHGSNFY